MQEELKHSNSIGDLKGIQHFASTVLKNGNIKIETARQICSFITGIRLNFNSAVAFFDYLGFIDVTDTTLTPTNTGTQLYLMLNCGFEKKLCEVCLCKIIKDEILRLDALKFDAISGRYYIQKHGFPLNSAIFRNVLIQLRVLSERNDGSFLLAEIYEAIFANANQTVERKLSLVRLKEQLLNQAVQGETAEKFVLEYELKRLSGSANSERIKRISDMDVTAGYDIVSFETDLSQKFDRFIEVKSYYGRLHFYWSENEIKIASSLGEKYYIYLVDAEKTSDEYYHPLIIRDPVNAVASSNIWLMQPTSYRVVLVDDFMESES